VEYTIEDAKYYVKPFTKREVFDLLPDTELIENICENEQDVQHTPSFAAQGKKGR
jgi:hypothetical protein